MSKYDLELSIPIMNAAGTLGFIQPRHALDCSNFGAFVTNPISLLPRQPANHPELIHYPGGFLIHSGYPNPGLRKIIRHSAAQWARSDIPIIVHLLCSNLAEFMRMGSYLEGLRGVSAIEVSLPPESNPTLVIEFIQAASLELPLIVRFPLDRAIVIAEQLPALPADSGVIAFSLGPPRGALIGSRNSIVHGRLYGPALFPLALAATHGLQSLGFPVIAAGGIYHAEQIQALLEAGALAVQLDSILWRGGLNQEVSVPEKS